MPVNNRIKKVLVIGSGAIVIGQAAEFDYAGTQACQALKEEKIEVLLVNSNPATIMTDKNIADKVYIEPLHIDILKKIILKENPDSILPTLGGQTGLNLATELVETGFLSEKNIQLLGTSIEAIRMSEDRSKFKDRMQQIGEPCNVSKVVSSVRDASDFANEINYPVMVRAAYTLGGAGSGIAYNSYELEKIVSNGLMQSRITQVLIEKCISGWKEIEYEVMRDRKGNVISVCNMENIDPVGIHTGDSIVVAPSQTLSDKEYQMLRNASIKIISSIKIQGGCNIQFALHPTSFKYVVIEVNPRISRSSALASKATGYPIAKVATKIAIGYGLDEIKNAVTGKTYSCFEPALDYVVVKVPKWPFDKFIKANRTLGTQMKSTGEVMAISNSFESALMKAIRSLELGTSSLYQEHYSNISLDKIKACLATANDERIFIIAEALRRGILIEEIYRLTNIDLLFLHKINQLILMENKLKAARKFGLSKEILLQAKKLGFTDDIISQYSNYSMEKLFKLKYESNCHAVYKMVDTCASEFNAMTPYYYSTYDRHCEIRESNFTNTDKNVLVIGSGPIQIGQGIEFDYCAVHAVWALKDEGYYSVIVNNNPETVSTDFNTANRLYLEPLTVEDLENIISVEKPIGAIVQFGGQTALKLAKQLQNMDVKILGTSPINIDIAEDRKKFDSMLERLRIPRPEGRSVITKEAALNAANELGYPVIVRPSYVLGGHSMEIAYSDNDITEFIDIIHRYKQERPILVDKYIIGTEVDVDAICDGQDILIPGIIEHIERTGIHSGDSISVYPTQTISNTVKSIIIDYTRILSLELRIIGLINIQYIICDNHVYVIEVNPRSSRTIPHMSKITGIPIVDLATKIICGKKLSDFKYGTGLYQDSKYVSVKVPVFSFEKLHDLDASLGPEMKSTGEVLGISLNFPEALYKAIISSGTKLPKNGDSILMSVKDSDKLELIPIAKGFRDLGINIYATHNTAYILNLNGIDTIKVRRVKSGAPDILDIIDSGKVSLIINTPTRGKNPDRHGFKIRRKAVEKFIPCLTSLDTAMAVLNCIKLNKEPKNLDVVELGDINYN